MRESAVVAIHTRVGNDHQNWKHTAKRLFAGSKMFNRERKRKRIRATMRPPCKAPFPRAQLRMTPSSRLSASI
jgi:hypothetical protein